MLVTNQVKPRRTSGGGTFSGGDGRFTISNVSVTCGLMSSYSYYDYARVRVSGRLKNQSGRLARAELQLVIYSSSDAVLVTEEFDVPFLAAVGGFGTSSKGNYIPDGGTRTFNEVWPYRDYREVCVPQSTYSLDILNIYHSL